MISHVPNSNPIEPDSGGNTNSVNALPSHGRRLIPGFLCEGCTVLWAGGPLCTNKSRFAIQLAVSLAYQVPFLGAKEFTPNRRYTVYVLGDEGDFGPELQKCCAARGIDHRREKVIYGSDILWYAGKDNPVDLSDPADVDLLIRQFADTECDVLVLDLHWPAVRLIPPELSERIRDFHYLTGTSLLFMTAGGRQYDSLIWPAQQLWICPYAKRIQHTNNRFSMHSSSFEDDRWFVLMDWDTHQTRVCSRVKNCSPCPRCCDPFEKWHWQRRPFGDGIESLCQM